MPWFSRKKKNPQLLDDFRIYADPQRKNAYKLMIDMSSTVQQLISQMKRASDQDIYLIILVSYENLKKKETNILCQRRLALHEQPVKLCNAYPNTFVYLMELPIIKYNEIRQYHMSVPPKFGAFIGQNHDQFDRLGTLLKKSKSGQYRERTFKLMKDCLIYFRKDKINYICLDSLEVQRVQSKENYVFILKVDQREYHLKTSSKTDYEGWIYSIQRQSNRVKETKLFSDYDKKIQQQQKQKMEHYKTLTTGICSSLKMLLQSAMANEFLQMVQKQSMVDYLLASQLKKYNKESFDSLIQLMKPQDEQNQIKPEEQGNFVHYLKEKKPVEYQRWILNDLSQDHVPTFLANALTYCETEYLPKFKLKGIHLVTRMPVARFNNYFKFSLPNQQLFWTDTYGEKTKYESYRTKI